jgi:Na+-transporting NADH:ubiquinone oxidoreductase subunit NqrC
MIQQDMKRILLLMLVLLTLGLVVLAVRSRLLKKQAQSRRETAYQSQLLSYTQDLKTGMTRKEVENYFRANKIEFRQMCCVADELSMRHSWDDLIKIGEEDVPMFCRGNNVYVAFRFNDYDNSERQDNDLDTLKSVTIYHELEGCL